MWLQPVEGDATKARCKICTGSVFQAHIKSIIGHKESKKHSELVKARCSTQQPSIAQSMVPQVQDPTRVAELKVAIYISGHSSNLSVDHLGELLPHLDKKSECLKGLKLHRTKCGRLQRNVIAPSFAKYLRNDIGESHFSLTVDVRQYTKFGRIIVDMESAFKPKIPLILQLRLGKD